MSFRVSKEEMDRIRAKIAGRKEKRLEKRKDLPWAVDKGGGKSGGKLAPKTRRKKTERQIMRDRLDALWSEAVRRRDLKLYGPLCRICHKSKDQLVGYHIVPKQRGDAIRWILENGCAGCVGCNWGEMNNRPLYRDKHISIFGKELIEKLEAAARIPAQYSMDDLKRIYREIKASMENG